MHVHTAFGNWFPGGREIILPLFVANGVTGVRDMGGDLPILLAWRKQIAAGEIVGPRMVVSGPMLDADLPDGKGLRFPSSVRVTTPASAVAAVDSLKAQGADFIKVQSVTSHDAYLAAAAEAKRIGLPIVGHVPDTVRLSEVIAAGQMSVEHLMGFSKAARPKRTNSFTVKAPWKFCQYPGSRAMRRAVPPAGGTPDLASSDDGVAARRGTARSARLEPSAAHSLRPGVLARRHLGSLQESNDAGPAARSARATPAIRRQEPANDGRDASRRRSISRGDRYRAGHLRVAGIQLA